MNERALRIGEIEREVRSRFRNKTEQEKHAVTLYIQSFLQTTVASDPLWLDPEEAVDISRIELPYGRAPTVDGALSPLEWDDARSLSIEVESGWTITVCFKHDGSNLYVAFTNLKDKDAELYPEVLLDVRNDHSSAWTVDDWWLHASYNDCEGRGEYNVWNCSPSKLGWSANNFPLESADTIEFQISYAKIGLAPENEKAIGIAFGVTDTQTRRHFWPGSAKLEKPSTWGEAIFSDKP